MKNETNRGAWHWVFLMGLVSGAGTLPAAAATDDSASAELQEIVVTAERKTEKLQDVPIAVTAVSAAELADRGVRQAGDITALVPNMMLNQPYGPEAQPTFTLRGVTTQDFSQNQSSPIAMYVDEVYKPVGAVQALQTYDLDRVEVLRGPQGTLYGKNATGGAVNFYSANPNLTEYDGYVTLGGGNYSDRSVRAAVGGPIVDNELGWRAAVYYEKRDGWVHSVAPDFITGAPSVEPLNGVDAVAGRFTLLAKPTDSLTATLKLSVSRSGGTPYGAHAIAIDPTVTGFTGNISWFDNGAKFAVHKDIRSDSASLKLDWQASDHVTLSSVTGFDYGRWYEKSDDGGLPITDRLDDPNTYFSSVNSFSQEIRLASHDTGAFGWLSGLYYGRESTHATVQFHFYDGPAFVYNPWAPTVPPSDPGIGSALPLYGFDEYNNFDQVKDSRAVFLNTTYEVTKTFTLRAGVRYTKDKVTINNFYALEGGLPSPGSVGTSPDIDASTWWTQTIGNIPLGTPAPRAYFQQGLAPQDLGVVPSFGKDTNNVSGKIGADWKPTDDVLAYLSISEGYRGVAFNGQAFNDRSELTFADPEKLVSYELGFKSSFANHRGIFNATLFHYDYKNQQFLDSFVLPGGLGSGFRTVNAPKSKVDGAEFELRGKVTPDLEIGSTLGLMHSRYAELTLHAGAFQAPGVPRVCCVGNQLIQAPDYNAGVDINWRMAHFSAGDLQLLLNGNFYGKQFFDAFNTQRDAQGGYGLGNARVQFASLDKRGYTVGVWVKNFTDRKYLAYALNQGDLDTGALGFDYALVGEPRTFGVDATYRF